MFDFIQVFAVHCITQITNYWWLQTELTLLIHSLFYSSVGWHPTCDVKNIFGFWVFLRCQSKSEKSVLSYLHTLADLLGNKMVIVICDWWISIHLSVFLCFKVHYIRSCVFEKCSKFYLSSKFFYLLYAETWQV